MKLKESTQILFTGLLCSVLSVAFTQTTLAQDSTSNPAIDKVLSKVESVIQSDNFIDNLVPDSNVALPFGIRKQIGAVRYVVAIDSCKFRPAGAYFNAYAAVDFPGTTKKLAFEAANIKFNPKGVVGGAQSRLMLVSEHTIRINNMVSLKLKDDGSNWIEWDCGGYKAINLTGHFIFNKGELIPDSSQTKETVVTASFHIYTADLHDFVTKVSITPFMIKDLKNWSFKVTNASVDMSELINTPGMIFPPGYSNPNMLTPAMWSGFYLQSVKVKLPSEISKAGKRTELIANNLLIDNMGVTGLFQINNLITLNEGSMSGWDYSIDELGVGFLCNKLNSGHLKGKLNIPVMDSAQSLAYTACIMYNPAIKEADYNFIINPANNIKFNVFSAQVNFNNNSTISVTRVKGLFKPTAILNGHISFNHKNFNSNGGQLLFQNLTIVTHAPYITQGLFTLHNIGNQTKVANYPASVNDIYFGFNIGAPILTFSVSINVMDNISSGFSAGTLLSLKGKIDAKPVNYTDEIQVSYTKTKWKFDKLTINGISLGVQTSVFALAGTVLFNENDPVYGDGFFGHILFSIDKVLPAPASVTARFGALTTYRYFYIDAAIPTNIQLGSSPITLTKIMGGLYYHMKPLNAGKNELITASKNQPANPTNALTYTPDPNYNLGFKAGVGYRYTPSTKTANGDVMLEVAFTKAGGLSFVSLDGTIYFMAEPHEQIKSPIAGSVSIQYDVTNQIFDADAAVAINAYNNSIKGNGFAKVHIEPGTWYACVGKPSNQNTINLFNMVNAQTYFMVGNKIDGALPPPAGVASIINQAGGLAQFRDETQLKNGSGFCAGASISAALSNEFGFDFFTVYGGFSFGLGFDMMMMDYGSNGYCSGNASEKIGLNGKLASGSMYLYMQGSVGVKGDFHLPFCNNCKNPVCLCKKFNFPILSGGVAAFVQGKLPKPLYFSGQAACYYDIFGVYKGNLNFDFNYGTNCTPVKN